jgi:hypothetical protein
MTAIPEAAVPEGSLCLEPKENVQTAGVPAFPRDPWCPTSILPNAAYFLQQVLAYDRMGVCNAGQ